MIFAAPRVEGERRDHHPPVADRRQIRLTSRVLLLQQGDRVGPVAAWPPTSMAGRVYLLTRFLSKRPSRLLPHSGAQPCSPSMV